MRRQVRGSLTEAAGNDHDRASDEEQDEKPKSQSPSADRP